MFLLLRVANKRFVLLSGLTLHSIACRAIMTSRGGSTPTACERLDSCKGSLNVLRLLRKQ